MWGSRGKSRIKDSAPAYIFAGSTLALAVVLYLAYASFFILKEVCPLCVATYVAVIGVFVISGGASSVPMSSAARSRPARSSRAGRHAARARHRAALRRRRGVGHDARSRARRSGPSSAAAQAAQPGSAHRVRALVGRAAEVRQLPLRQRRREGADRRVRRLPVPALPGSTSRSSRSSTTYAEQPKDVKFIFKTWPLNSDCNAIVPTRMHIAACDASAADVMARPKGHGREDEGLVLRAPGRAEPVDDPATPRRHRPASRTSTRRSGQGAPGSEDRRRRLDRRSA